MIFFVFNFPSPKGRGKFITKKITSAIFEFHELSCDYELITQIKTVKVMSISVFISLKDVIMAISYNKIITTFSVIKTQFFRKRQE